MATVMPFHSRAPNAPPVFHDDNRCKLGHDISLLDRTEGTGGLNKCEDCVRLAPGRWVEMEQSAPTARRHGMGMRWRKG